jgi:hypothetical protein
MRRSQMSPPGYLPATALPRLSPCPVACAFPPTPSQSPRQKPATRRRLQVVHSLSPWFSLQPRQVQFAAHILYNRRHRKTDKRKMRLHGRKPTVRATKPIRCGRICFYWKQRWVVPTRPEASAFGKCRNFSRPDASALANVGTFRAPTSAPSPISELLAPRHQRARQSRNFWRPVISVLANLGTFRAPKPADRPSIRSRALGKLRKRLQLFFKLQRYRRT